MYVYYIHMIYIYVSMYIVYIYIYIYFFLTETDETRDSRERVETIFILFQLPLAHKHSDIYLHICWRDDYLIFSISLHVITATQ